MRSVLKEALQNLHEQAHPEGTVFVEYCREPECTELLGWVRLYG